MNKDRVGVAVIIVCLFGLLLIGIITPSEDENRIKVLEQRIELLKERCDDFQYTINRINAVEATLQHQQEALDTIDWATRHRY